VNNASDPATDQVMRLLPTLAGWLLCACVPEPDAAPSTTTSPTADTALATCGGTAPAILDVQPASAPAPCTGFLLRLDDADGDLSPAVLWAWHDEVADGEVLQNVDAERVELPFAGGTCTTDVADTTVQFCPEGTLGVEWAFVVEDATGLRSENYLYAESR